MAGFLFSSDYRVASAALLENMRIDLSELPHSFMVSSMLISTSSAATPDLGFLPLAIVSIVGVIVHQSCVHRLQRGMPGALSEALHSRLRFIHRY